MLDALQSIFKPIYAALLTREVAMDMSHRRLERSQALLDRGQATFDIANILLKLGDISIDAPQVYEDKILELVDHAL